MRKHRPASDRNVQPMEKHMTARNIVPKIASNGALLTPFNTEAVDGLSIRCSQLQGLASCLVVLGEEHEHSSHFLSHDALSQLGYVMIELADDAERLKDRMWDEHMADRKAVGG
jgi:hypothetical protein